jgi:hypothetical protein
MTIGPFWLKKAARGLVGVQTAFDSWPGVSVARAAWT